MKQIILNNISTSYFITKDGKCYNSNTGKFLQGQENYKNHYFSYLLTLPDGKKVRRYAHRLVADAFLSKPAPDKIEINHKDGNKLNNYVDNLQWVTKKENSSHALERELRTFDHVFCFDRNKKLVAEYKNVAEAARAVAISKNMIFQELQKEVKALTGGFYWSRNNYLNQVKNYPNAGKAKQVFQYDLNGKFINSYCSTGAAARSLGIKSSSHIGECCRGKIKTYKGFIWRYSEDIVSPFKET